MFTKIPAVGAWSGYDGLCGRGRLEKNAATIIAGAESAREHLRRPPLGRPSEAELSRRVSSGLLAAEQAQTFSLIGRKQHAKRSEQQAIVVERFSQSEAPDRPGQMEVRPNVDYRGPRSQSG